MSLDPIFGSQGVGSVCIFGGPDLVAERSPSDLVAERSPRRSRLDSSLLQVWSDSNGAWVDGVVEEWSRGQQEWLRSKAVLNVAFAMEF